MARGDVSAAASSGIRDAAPRRAKAPSLHRGSSGATHRCGPNCGADLRCLGRRNDVLRAYRAGGWEARKSDGTAPSREPGARTMRIWPNGIRSPGIPALKDTETTKASVSRLEINVRRICVPRSRRLVDSDGESVLCPAVDCSSWSLAFRSRLARCCQALRGSSPNSPTHLSLVVLLTDVWLAPSPGRRSGLGP